MLKIQTNIFQWQKQFELGIQWQFCWSKEQQELSSSATSSSWSQREKESWESEEHEDLNQHHEQRQEIFWNQLQDQFIKNNDK